MPVSSRLWLSHVLWFSFSCLTLCLPLSLCCCLFFISLKLVVCHFLLYLQCVWEEISLHSILTLNITSLQSSYTQYLIQKSGQIKYYIYRRYNKCSDPFFITLWNHHWQHYRFCVDFPRYPLSVPRSSLKNHQALLRLSALGVFMWFSSVHNWATWGFRLFFEANPALSLLCDFKYWNMISCTETWTHKHGIFFKDMALPVRRSLPHGILQASYFIGIQLN